MFQFADVDSETNKKSTTSSDDHMIMPSKYCFPSVEDDEIIVRMENCVHVDRTKRGGSDPNTADELDRILIVLCEGYGSISMLGARHKNETFVGGNEMSSLACNSLLGDLQILPLQKEQKETPSERCGLLLEAFQHCEERLQRALFDGSSRHSTVGESLVDGLYFQNISSVKPLLPSTIVAKTCDVIGDTPSIRYICQSGHKIDVNCGVCATVLDCTPNTICCANVGGVLAAVFTSNAKRLLPGEATFSSFETNKNLQTFSYEWLTQSHTVNNLNERKRLRDNFDTFTAPDETHFIYSGSPCSPFRNNDIRELIEANRYSRSLGRQTVLRKQGMTAKPSVSHAIMEPGQWIVVASSGFWRAIDKNEDLAAKKIATLIGESKQIHCNEPNKLADLLVETAAKSNECDNVTVVVLNKH